MFSLNYKHFFLNLKNKKNSTFAHQMLQKIKPHLALFSANAFYGANYSIAKMVMPQYLSPFAFIFLRVSGALLVFGFIHRLFIQEKVHKKDLMRLLLCGMFGVAANQLMFFKGLNKTIPINASVIMITTPILVMLFSSIFWKEKLAWYKLLGLALGIAGAFFIIGGSQLNFNSTTAKGDILIMLNAISYAIYLILVKPLMAKYKPLTVMLWVFFFGFFPVLFFSFAEIKAVEWHTFLPSTWLALAFVVLGVTVLAYLLNIYGLSKVNPSVVGAYIYLQPILALFFAWLIVGKTELTMQKIWASLLIFVGVYLVSFGKNHFEKNKKIRL